MDLLLIFDETKSYYVNIKDFDRFMFHKTTTTTKKQIFRLTYNHLQCYKYAIFIALKYKIFL